MVNRVDAYSEDYFMTLRFWFRRDRIYKILWFDNGAKFLYSFISLV